MSQMIDFTVPSTVPGRTLHAFRCVPEGEVKAVLQLSHGMVEFIDRYKPLAEYLAGRGILVTGHDHLGHGGSIRTKADYGYFAEPDGNRAVLADLHAMIGVYRLAIKWGGISPARRQSLQRLKTGLSVLFISLGLLSLLALWRVAPPDSPEARQQHANIVTEMQR